MITPEQLEEIYDLANEIEDEQIVIFVITSSPGEELIGIDVLEYWSEDSIDGGLLTYEEAIELIMYHHLDENE